MMKRPLTKPFYDAYLYVAERYPIVASIETAAAMLRGNSGKRLIQRSIERALDFRKEVQRLREEGQDGWFFDIWQPAVDKAECWPVAPGETGTVFKRCRCGSWRI